MKVSYLLLSKNGIVCALTDKTILYGNSALTKQNIFYKT